MQDDFGATFRRAIEEIHAGARELKSPMCEVCEAAGVARATPRRYRSARLPATIQNIVKLQREIAKRRAALGGQCA